MGFRIKLIFPGKFHREINTLCNHIPHGMGVLAAFLRQHNCHVEQTDLSIKYNNYSNFSPFIFSNIVLGRDSKFKEVDEVLKIPHINRKLDSLFGKISNSISINEFDAIGFSVFSYHHFIFATMLSQKIKNKANLPIIFGGPFISLFGHFYPEVFSVIDYMIVGDGGPPLIKLLECLKNGSDINKVPNLIYKINEKLISNPRSCYSIEDNPAPDFTDLSLELYKNYYSDFSGCDTLLPYQISRGCTGNCSFCNHKYIDHKLEFKSHEKVVAELSAMKARYNKRMFYFCDTAINNSYDYLDTLCGLFIKNKLDICWSTYAKVDNLDRRILRKMKKAGCRCLRFGIESGSDSVLKSINKGHTTEQAEEVLKNSAEEGIRNYIFLIAGYPYETEKDVRKTKDFIRKNKRNIYYVESNRFLLSYGSLMYRHPERYRIGNLAPTVFRYTFCFNETYGQRWNDKKRQQDCRLNQLRKEAYINMRFFCKLKVFLHYAFTLSRYVLIKTREFTPLF